jgi:anti-sigma factor RsiW
MTDVTGGHVGFDVLSAYLDGELDDRERATVEATLAASSEWRAELAAIRDARNALRSLPHRDAPPGFWDDVYAAVANDVVAEPRATISRTARSRVRRPGRLVGVAAAAAALVAVLVLPGRPQVRPDVATLLTRHGAQSADAGDPISMLAPVGPLAGLRR